MNRPDYKEVVGLVTTGEFDSAYDVVSSMSLEEIVDKILMEASFDDSDYVFYRFVIYLEKKFDCLDVAFQAARLISTALARTPGAYYLAAHHVLRAVNNRDNMSDLDLALFISQTPHKPIDSKVVKTICHRLLEKDPSHTEARNIVKSLED